MHALSPKRVLILEPAFVEYSRASAAVNAQITTALLTEERGFTPDFESLLRAVKERHFRFSDLELTSQSDRRFVSEKRTLFLIDAAEGTTLQCCLMKHSSICAASELGFPGSDKPHLMCWLTHKVLRDARSRIGYVVCAAKVAGRVREQIDPWSYQRSRWKRTCCLDEVSSTWNPPRQCRGA